MDNFYAADLIGVLKEIESDLQDLASISDAINALEDSVDDMVNAINYLTDKLGEENEN